MRGLPGGEGGRGKKGGALLLGRGHGRACPRGILAWGFTLRPVCVSPLLPCANSSVLIGLRTSPSARLSSKSSPTHLVPLGRSGGLSPKSWPPKQRPTTNEGSRGLFPASPLCVSCFRLSSHRQQMPRRLKSGESGRKKGGNNSGQGQGGISLSAGGQGSRSCGRAAGRRRCCSGSGSGGSGASLAYRATAACTTFSSSPRQTRVRLSHSPVLEIVAAPAAGGRCVGGRCLGTARQTSLSGLDEYVSALLESDHGGGEDADGALGVVGGGPDGADGALVSGS